MLTVINPLGLFDAEIHDSNIDALRTALDSRADYCVLDTDDFIVNKVTYAQLYKVIRYKGIEMYNITYNKGKPYEMGLSYHFNKTRRGLKISNIDYVNPNSFFFNQVKVKQVTWHSIRIWFGRYTHGIQLKFETHNDYIIQHELYYDKKIYHGKEAYCDKEILCKAHHDNIHEFAMTTYLEVMYFFKFKDLIFCKIGVLMYDFVLKFNLIFTQVGELVGIAPEQPYDKQWKFLEVNNKYMSDKKINTICTKYLFARSGGVIKY